MFFTKKILDFFSSQIYRYTFMFFIFLLFINPYLGDPTTSVGGNIIFYITIDTFYSW